MKKLLTLFASLIFITGLVGCDKTDNTTDPQQKTIITVGTSPGPYSELFLTAIKPILEKEGYSIKAVDFSNLRLADIALNDGDIDVNVDQHTAYYQDFNTNTNGDLISITQIPTVPAGLYAGQKTSLSAVAQGDKVAIPQDPSNAARAYALLQKAGWITLKPGTEITKATANDIANNKYGIDIIEMDSATIPRSLADLAYAVIPGSVAYAAGVDINGNLLQEDLLEHLILVATVKATNKYTPWAKAIVAAYHSDEFKQYLQQHNQNHYWFVPESLQ
ncbi:MetQ/NlpA family ABC transporter substrate-binding protein [Orbus mooreae]|uniref:MetQ/NlpA family ABC transporter substrate-binding protein n=1 Tax=Orbus mooreae TaxID=3074107 RepID=UPI00370DA721